MILDLHNYVCVLCPIGTFSFESRTDEVSRCESLFHTSCTDGNVLLPFMNHSFEEVSQNNPISGSVIMHAIQTVDDNVSSEI